MPPEQQQQNTQDQGGPPKSWKSFDLQEFDGINTQSPRQSIEDNQFSWLENFFPVGRGNMRAMYGKGTDLYTAPAGKTLVYFFHYVLAGTAYVVVFLSDGTAYQINAVTGIPTTISAVATTFYAGAQLPGCNQWGSKYLQIVNNITTNGYWLWDGTVLYTSGGISPEYTITNGGSGYAGTPVVSFSGGGGTGAAATAVMSGGVVVGLIITNAGTGYTSVPTVAFSGGGAAAATVTLMPSGVSGTTIENYQSRVWIGNGANGTFSAPGSVSNFATSSGGGTFISNDGFLKTAFYTFKQANSYLYTLADSSVNSINNVQSLGSPPTTTFNNLNVDPQVGTPWRDSVSAYGRALSLGNSSGFYLMYGGAAEKVSPQLDGVFSTATVPSTGNGIPSAVATIFGIKVVMFLMTVMDPFTNTLTPKLLIYEPERKRWFVGSQEVVLTWIATQEVQSVLTAWGTDGTTLFKLFNRPSTTLTKKGKTRLWMGDSWLWKKQELRIYLQSFDNSGAGAVVTVTVDNENGSTSGTSLLGAGPLNFVNNSGGVLTFVNNSSGVLQFTSTGVTVAMQNVDSSYGNMMGMTFTSVSSDFTMVALGMAYQNYTYLM